MKISTLLFVFLLVCTVVQSGDLITINSGTAEDKSKKWVLVEDDCENPEVVCNQVYVEKSEEDEYLKNKEINNQKKISSQTVVAPNKADSYQQLVRYFNPQDTSEMIPVIIQYTNLGSKTSSPQENRNTGEAILAGLELSSYRFDSYDGLKEGVVLIEVNKEALTDLFKNTSVLMIVDPNTTKIHKR